ncbi:MAG: hypothetical protein V2J26_09420 [Pacificimonas sp.]|nr:hypothetical protein [Pacificimonas sp.]
MEKFLALGAASIAFAITAPASAAFLPSGVQTHVLKTTVTNDWGWTQCYQGAYSASVQLSTLFASCSGDYLMLAASPSDSDLNFSVLAGAATVDVTMPVFNNNTTNSNGVEWYYGGDAASWGFAHDGAAVNRGNCDVNGLSEETRLCWHVGSTEVFGGWRAGSSFGLNFDSVFQRYVFTADNLNAPSEVPAPAGLALLGLGLFALGRRRAA